MYLTCAAYVHVCVCVCVCVCVNARCLYRVFYLFEANDMLVFVCNQVICCEFLNAGRPFSCAKD